MEVLVDRILEKAPPHVGRNIQAWPVAALGVAAPSTALQAVASAQTRHDRLSIQ